jgi:cytochrome c peroxidase
MALFNLAWSPNFTWDGRRTRLRDQVLAPIVDHRELNQSLRATREKLGRDSQYRKEFAAAFGDATITSERIGLAVEQYLLTVIAGDSKFDRAGRGEVEFTAQEKQGLLLFMTEYNPAREQFGADCFHCHGGMLFTDNALHNNGLKLSAQDIGRRAITGRAEDQGKFRTPSLRNVAITGPYMHDGRFRTLEEVVDHYSTGVQISPTLDPNLAKHPAEGIRLSKPNRAALVAFLRTLTDLHSKR